MEDKREKVKEWYDDFTFGNKKDIYNPWSITSNQENGFGRYRKNGIKVNSREKL